MPASVIKFSIKRAFGRVVCTVCSRRTVIRIARVPGGRITSEWIHGHFPYGVSFNDSTHVFSHEVMGGAVFMAALPLEAVRQTVDECRRMCSKPVNISRIDVIERQLFKKYMGGAKACWVCLEMDGGMRILMLENGSPSSAHFVSASPMFRETELNRMKLPDEAVVLGGCDWLNAFLTEAGVPHFDAF